MKSAEAAICHLLPPWDHARSHPAQHLIIIVQKARIRAATGKVHVDPCDRHGASPRAETRELAGVRSTTRSISRHSKACLALSRSLLRSVRSAARCARRRRRRWRDVDSRRSRFGSVPLRRAADGVVCGGRVRPSDAMPSGPGAGLQAPTQKPRVSLPSIQAIFGLSRNGAPASYYTTLTGQTRSSS